MLSAALKLASPPTLKVEPTYSLSVLVFSVMDVSALPLA